MPTVPGSLHLFRVSGISVYLHWSWFVVAVIELYVREGSYDSPIWNVFEYLALFGLVTMHEFGHAFACRSTGGRAERIVLWPLGGVAYVEPPERPGAWLWSIVAGPLVNFVMVPVLGLAWFLIGTSSLVDTAPNLYALMSAVFVINLGMLIFNLLPFHPLDGGQIVRSLLWFVLGRSRSLLVTSLFGVVGVAGLAFLAFRQGSIWLGILALFFAASCRAAFLRARLLARIDEAPPRAGASCPACHAHPPTGDLWNCARCGGTFDVFATGGTCPHCTTEFPITKCTVCGEPSPIIAWSPAPAAAAAPP